MGSMLKTKPSLFAPSAAGPRPTTGTIQNFAEILLDGDKAVIMIHPSLKHLVLVGSQAAGFEAESES